MRITNILNITNSRSWVGGCGLWEKKETISEFFFFFFFDLWCDASLITIACLVVGHLSVFHDIPKRNACTLPQLGLESCLGILRRTHKWFGVSSYRNGSNKNFFVDKVRNRRWSGTRPPMGIPHCWLLLSSASTTCAVFCIANDIDQLLHGSFIRISQNCKHNGQRTHVG